jgi:sirohydrochlorin cobaltochelatase
MKKAIRILTLLGVLMALVSCATSGMSKADEKPVILIAAFGSSYESGQKNLEDMDAAYRKAFPDYDIYWAFTADFIVNALRESGQTTVFANGTTFYTVDEAMDMLRDKGVKNVAVQCLMNMVGGEYRQVLNVSTKGMNVKYGHPLFFHPEDIQNAANAMAPDFGGAGEFTILAGHGNDHHPEFNAELIQLDNYLQENYDNVRVATVEGAPLFGDDLVAEVAASGAAKIRFVPLMITYGDHISNDVMGDEEDSWKTIIGLDASCADGMGSNAAIQEIFIGSTSRVLKEF